MEKNTRNSSDISNLPGQFEDEVHSFPKLTRPRSDGGTNQWQIKVAPSANPPYYWTEYGKVSKSDTNKDYVIQQSARKVVKKGKNIGRSNETTPREQALMEAYSEFRKKVDSGYSTSTITLSTPKWKYYPMALHKFDDVVDKDAVIYPCFSQPKLDGVRVLATWHESEVKLYSRNGKVFTGFSNIKSELNPILRDRPCLYLDGEFYKHGLNLQTISGIVRNEEQSETSTISIHFFDCFEIKDGSVVGSRFEDRYEVLTSVLPGRSRNLVAVETTLIESRQELDAKFREYVHSGYEGQIVRLQNSKYETSTSRTIRSYSTLKRKVEYSDEFKIVDFKSGDKGKAKGAIIWVLETENGKRFSANPKMTYEERYSIYKDALKNFRDKYYGKMATVSFQDWSSGGVPLRAQVETIRDYE